MRTKSEFGDGRFGEVRCAADIPEGIAGNRSKVAAFALEANIPVLLRRGAAAALGGQLDLCRDISSSRKQGVDILS